MEKKPVTVRAVVEAPIEKVWEYWTTPDHIMRWNNASEDWHTPMSVNDLRTGGKFKSRMESRDGSMGFDFEGTYDVVLTNDKIEYTLADGRKVVVEFTPNKDQTSIEETFEAESENSLEMQQQGWQAILDNFKKYVESNK